MDFDKTLNNILESYGGKGLNPGLWTPNGSLRLEISDNLLRVAYDFIKQHVIADDAIEDITITGSLANFNWSEYSDIDLHIIINYDKINGDGKLLNDYYKLAKSMWNSTHEIQICDHEVEVYVQDSCEKHYSTGVYSLQSKKWLVKPQSHTSAKPNELLVNQKAKDFGARIEKIERMAKDKQEGTLEKAEKIKNRIKHMRKAGLVSAGEFSIENLVFKYLRNNGYLDRLSKLCRAVYDNELSVYHCKS